MHPEKIEVDKIQNGRLSAIIHLDRPDIVEYHENRSRYLSIKQIVRFQERMHFEKNPFSSQKGRQSVTINHYG